MAKNFRLFITEELIINNIVTLDDKQTHYLKNVVKYQANDTLSCFDNKNGEFCCKIIEFNKKSTTLKVIEKIKELQPCPDIWLLFAPIKKDNTDFVIQKATELGCSKIIPVITKHTITQNIKIDRYILQSIEAAEQCRRTDLPQINNSITLRDVLNNWDTSRTLFFLDETLNSQNFLEVLKEDESIKSAILVGPEGGFSHDELVYLRGLNFVKGATLGPRILRAETAAIASLGCWQLIKGDWSK